MPASPDGLTDQVFGDPELLCQLRARLTIAMPFENGVHLLVRQLASPARGESSIECGRIARTRGRAWRSAACPDSRAARLAERFLREGLDSKNAMRSCSARGEPPALPPILREG